MKTRYSIICSILLLLSITSCKQSSFEEEMGVFNNSHIKLMLDSMMYMQQDKSFSSIKSEYTYIVYVDSVSCSDCALNHFKDWTEFESLFERDKFSYLFIVTPKEIEKTSVMEKVKSDILFNDRIYIDTAGIFERNNPLLPQNKLLHTFMINKNDTVILIGNPINNPKIKKLFHRILNQKKTMT